jgi:hypothetical protein
MGIRTFAFVAGDDVFTIFKIDDSDLGNAAVAAGMSSNPIIIETDNQMIDVGWKFINGEFYMPASLLASTAEPDYEVDDD